MTAVQKHLLEIVRRADNLTPTQMMDLHNIAMDRLKAEHEAERELWEADREELRGRLAAALLRNYDLNSKIGREKTKYFCFLFLAVCCILWALTKTGKIA